MGEAAHKGGDRGKNTRSGFGGTFLGGAWGPAGPGRASRELGPPGPPAPTRRATNFPHGRDGAYPLDSPP